MWNSRVGKGSLPIPNGNNPIKYIYITNIQQFKKKKKKKKGNTNIYITNSQYYTFDVNHLIISFFNKNPKPAC